MTHEFFKLTPWQWEASLGRRHVLAIGAARLQDIYRDGYDIDRRFKRFETFGETIHRYRLRS